MDTFVCPFDSLQLYNVDLAELSGCRQMTDMCTHKSPIITYVPHVTVTKLGNDELTSHRSLRHKHLALSNGWKSTVYTFK